jgi:hypothetical protein
MLTPKMKNWVAALTVAGGIGVAQAQQQIVSDSIRHASSVTGTMVEWQ